MYCINYADKFEKIIGKDQLTSMPANSFIISRFVRYKPGGIFAPHEDNCFSKSSNDRSFWTVNIYLNDVFERNGGATRFIDSIQEHDITKGNEIFVNN